MNRRGFALESTLLLLVLLGSLIGIATAAVAVYARTSGVDVKATRVAYAAEGAGDQIMAQLDAAMADGVITPSDITSLATPAVPGFAFTQTTQNAGAPTIRTITRGAFKGLYALEQPMSVNITATDSLNNKASIALGVALQAIPIFQFGVFYDGDLEITNGPPMTFIGWIHTNRNLYLSSANAIYLSQLTAADSVFWNRKDFDLVLGGVQIANNAGTLVSLDFDSRSQPGAAFAARSELQFDGRLKSAASGVTRLRLPLPTGMNPRELILPARAGDTPEVAQVRMANKADLRIVINLAAPLTNLCVQATFVRAAGRAALGADCPAIFSLARDAFWDGREMRRPDVLEVNMSALRAHVNASPGNRQVNIVYVEFQGRDTMVTGRDYPAVRLRNGSELPLPPVAGDPGGVTVATNAALYVQGDYNTVNWKPAAMMADVATFLSNDWADSASTIYPRPRTWAATTVNAALLAGISETPCDWMACGPNAYGGGLENFPRFLEDWGGSVGGTAFNYSGSLVSLFVSQQSGQVWGHELNGGAGCYEPPTRNWGFDTHFQNPLLLPPGTPRLGSVMQVAFRSIF